MATIQISTSKFVDLDMTFSRHPVSGDVLVKKDVESIKFAIKNILLTTTYPFHPEKECRISEMLFENFTPVVKAVCAREIQNTILNMEPRAILNGVTFSEDLTNGAITITIEFTPTNINESVSFNILLERIR